MSYKAEISASENAGEIYKCLLPENASRERSTLSAKVEDGKIFVSIEAKDATAFRATINAVTQALSVCDKAKRIQ